MMAYEAVAVMDHNGSLPNYLVANKSVQYSTLIVSNNRGLSRIYR